MSRTYLSLRGGFQLSALESSYHLPTSAPICDGALEILSCSGSFEVESASMVRVFDGRGTQPIMVMAVCVQFVDAALCRHAYFNQQECLHLNLSRTYSPLRVWLHVIFLMLPFYSMGTFMASYNILLVLILCDVLSDLVVVYLIYLLFALPCPRLSSRFAGLKCPLWFAVFVVLLCSVYSFFKNALLVVVL